MNVNKLFSLEDSRDVLILYNATTFFFIYVLGSVML